MASTRVWAQTCAKIECRAAPLDLDLVVIGGGLLHRAVARDWRIASGSGTPRFAASVR